jgi:hypothetical protein
MSEAAMSPAGVQEQAAAEGLVLQRSAKNATGFLNVKHIYTYDGRTNRRKPFAAQIYSDGRHTCLGNFATAEEAALAYARAAKVIVRRPRAVTMREAAISSAEAQAQAAAEGLVLQRSAKNATGFMNVKHDERTKSRKPFAAQIYSDGQLKHLGSFVTAEEAALAYARALNAVEAQEQVSTEGGTSSKRRRKSGAQHSDTDEASDGCQVVLVEVEAEAEDSEEEGAVLVDAVMVVAPHVSAQAQRRQPGASLMALLPQVPCSPIASRLAIRSGAPPPF